MGDVEERLVALESRLAHHEVMAEEISEVLARQDQTIALLTAQVQRLRDRIAELEGGWSPSPQDEKPPPHY